MLVHQPVSATPGVIIRKENYLIVKIPKNWQANLLPLLLQLSKGYTGQFLFQFVLLPLSGGRVFLSWALLQQAGFRVLGLRDINLLILSIAITLILPFAFKAYFYWPSMDFTNFNHHYCGCFSLLSNWIYPPLVCKHGKIGISSNFSTPACFYIIDLSSESCHTDSAIHNCTMLVSGVILNKHKTSISAHEHHIELSTEATMFGSAASLLGAGRVKAVQ
ncbi:hypothetical protein Tco_0940553 [Tanacetum coccineum]|uniref:Uncharacterized protein n=1 Tax=Tanacetum coccineum TaxID=301880 RepID=A0ABQ5DP86_9ASTR